MGWSGASPSFPSSPSLLFVLLLFLSYFRLVSFSSFRSTSFYFLFPSGGLIYKEHRQPLSATATRSLIISDHLVVAINIWSQTCFPPAVAPIFCGGKNISATSFVGGRYYPH